MSWVCAMYLVPYNATSSSAPRVLPRRTRASLSPPSVMRVTCVAPSPHCRGSGAGGDQDDAHTSPSGLDSLKYHKWYETDSYDKNFPDLQPPDIFDPFLPQPVHYKSDGGNACIRIFSADNRENFATHDVYWRYNATRKRFEVCYLDRVKKKYVKIRDPKEGRWYRFESV